MKVCQLCSREDCYACYFCEEVVKCSRCWIDKRNARYGHECFPRLIYIRLLDHGVCDDHGNENIGICLECSRKLCTKCIECPSHESILLKIPVKNQNRLFLIFDMIENICLTSTKTVSNGKNIIQWIPSFFSYSKSVKQELQFLLRLSKAKLIDFDLDFSDISKRIEAFNQIFFDHYKDNLSQAIIQYQHLFPEFLSNSSAKSSITHCVPAISSDDIQRKNDFFKLMSLCQEVPTVHNLTEGLQVRIVMIDTSYSLVVYASPYARDLWKLSEIMNVLHKYQCFQPLTSWKRQFGNCVLLCEIEFPNRIIWCEKSPPRWLRGLVKEKQGSLVVELVDLGGLEFNLLDLTAQLFIMKANVEDQQLKAAKAHLLLINPMSSLRGLNDKPSEAVDQSTFQYVLLLEFTIQKLNRRFVTLENLISRDSLGDFFHNVLLNSSTSSNPVLSQSEADRDLPITCYPPIVLSAGDLAIKVLHVSTTNPANGKNDNKLFVTASLVKWISTLDEMEDDLQMLYKAPGSFKPLTVEHLLKNSAIVAIFTDNQKWYRARMLERAVQCDSYKVHFIDYGNVDTVHRRLLRKIDVKFLSVPPLAVTCMLTNFSQISMPLSEKDFIKLDEALIDQNFILQLDQPVNIHLDDTYQPFTATLLHPNGSPFTFVPNFNSPQLNHKMGTPQPASFSRTSRPDRISTSNYTKDAKADTFSSDSDPDEAPATCSSYQMLHFQNPSNFYISHFKSLNIAELCQSLCSIYDAHPSTVPSLLNCNKIDKLCVVKLQLSILGQKPFPFWRARLCSLPSQRNSSHCKVYLIDHGSVHRLSVNKIYCYPTNKANCRHTLKIRQTPELALPCALYGVMPPCKLPHWSVTTINFLKKFLSSRHSNDWQIDAAVQDGGRWWVNIHYKTVATHGRTRNLASVLIKKGLAIDEPSKTLCLSHSTLPQVSSKCPLNEEEKEDPNSSIEFRDLPSTHGKPCSSKNRCHTKMESFKPFPLLENFECEPVNIVHVNANLRFFFVRQDFLYDTVLNNLNVNLKNVIDTVRPFPRSEAQFPTGAACLVSTQHGVFRAMCIACLFKIHEMVKLLLIDSGKIIHSYVPLVYPLSALLDQIKDHNRLKILQDCLALEPLVYCAQLDHIYPINPLCPEDFSFRFWRDFIVQEVPKYVVNKDNCKISVCRVIPPEENVIHEYPHSEPVSYESVTDGLCNLPPTHCLAVRIVCPGFLEIPDLFEVGDGLCFENWAFRNDISNPDASFHTTFAIFLDYANLKLHKSMENLIYPIRVTNFEEPTKFFVQFAVFEENFPRVRGDEFIVQQLQTVYRFLMCDHQLEMEMAPSLGRDANSDLINSECCVYDETNEIWVRGRIFRFKKGEYYLVDAVDDGRVLISTLDKMHKCTNTRDIPAACCKFEWTRVQRDLKCSLKPEEKLAKMRQLISSTDLVYGQIVKVYEDGRLPLMKLYYDKLGEQPLVQLFRGILRESD